MSKLVSSRLTGISCTKCGDIIPGGVPRFKKGNMYTCAPTCKPRLSHNDELTLLTNDYINNK